jgi:hypothetical protein
MWSTRSAANYYFFIRDGLFSIKQIILMNFLGLRFISILRLRLKIRLDNCRPEYHRIA